MTSIHCFIADAGASDLTIGHLKESPLVSAVTLIPADQVTSSAAMKEMAARAEGSDYALLLTRPDTLVPGYLALERMVRIAADSGAGMVYADSYKVDAEGRRSIAPVIDYQEGSLRDDFDFGPLLLFRTADLRRAAEGIDADYRAAGLYDLRLRLSRIAPIVHINEYLYTTVAAPRDEQCEAIFSYVDPRNRGSQLEMEAACTAHLKAVGGYLEPNFEPVDFNCEGFPVEASVIIPVRNRVRTIRDAIRSVLAQQTDFDFNLIIVDNGSTDGTTAAIDEFAADPRLIHIIPERDDLGIGGCWNMAVNHPACGKFAVQLDSDDIYSGPDTLSRIVAAFYEQQCGMVVGTYKLTDIDLNTLPPGVIDHKEWTPDNGRNNALRINGLGAPRAFFTPMLRAIGVPNTSYGEDYALGLAFSRRHQIGRIYDVLYFCRRWEDNSDHALDITRTNANNLYKDRIRTWELQARRALNRAK